MEKNSGERGGKDSIIENKYDIHTQYEYDMTYTIENIIMKSVIYTMRNLEISLQPALLYFI